jgi:hypothetical protein
VRDGIVVRAIAWYFVEQDAEGAGGARNLLFGSCIEPQLYAAESVRIQSTPPESLDAWGCVIRALTHLGRHEKEEIERAKQILRRAIDLSPKYAKAYILGICQKFGFRVELINGNVSPAKRAKIDDDFRAGRIDGIVGSPPTAAMGFNWQYWNGQEVEHVMFVSIDYKDSNFKQAYRRMMREPCQTPLRISVYEYERSIDQRIFEIVNRKSQDANLVDSSHEALRLGA